MAKIAPKGKKVTGTKKKDKITWTSSKPWNRALTVNAGKGNDVINFKKSKFKNTLNGQDGNDKIYGGKNIDKINGGNGSDKLYGYAGNDIIKGGKGNDYIDGGAGNDKIYGQYNTNKLKGGAGNDKIYSGTGTDHIWGGKNNDIINAGKGSNIIYFANGDGNDIIMNGGGTDTLVFKDETPLAPDEMAPPFAMGGTLWTKWADNEIDLIITGENGNNKVTLKDYGKGNHSVKYITVGNRTFTTDSLIEKNYVDVPDENFIYNGSSKPDYISVENYNRPMQVNAGAGDDDILVRGSGVSNNTPWITVDTGEGNDTVNVTGYAMAKVLLKAGNGNDTIVGIKSDGSNANRVNLVYGDNPDLLIRTVGSTKYILGEMKGDDLIIKLTNGETVTVKDYNLLDDAGKNCLFYGDDNIKDFVKALLVFKEPNVTKLTKNNSTYDNSSSNETEIVIANDNANYDIKLGRGYNNQVVITGNGDHKIVAGSGSKQYILIEDSNGGAIQGSADINLFGNYNDVTVKATGDNTVVLDYANRNSIKLYGGNKNVVKTEHEGVENMIVSTGKTNEIWSMSGSNFMDVGYGGDSDETRSYNRIRSTGNDSITARGYSYINLMGTDKTFTINTNFLKDNTSNTETGVHSGVDKNKIQISVQDDNVISQLTQYYSLYNMGNAQIPIDPIYYGAMDENGTLLDNQIIIWGAFNHDTKTFINDINKDLFVQDSVTRDLSDLTQVFDMQYSSNLNVFYQDTDLLYDEYKELIVIGSSKYDNHIRIAGTSDKRTTVRTVASSNKIESNGYDTIIVNNQGVSRNGVDTITVSGANQEKTVMVQTGSKAIIKNVMNLTHNDSSKNPLVINFSDQDFTNGDVMVYHDYFENELHFVTRHNGLDVSVTGIYDGDFNRENQEGSNYLIDTDGKLPFAKFAITDKNGNGANIRELTNYWDMANHSNSFDNEWSAITDGQSGSQNWFIDGTDSNDLYGTIIPSNSKIDIYDIGGNDTLVFDGSFISYTNSIQGSAGYSTFFDVKITADEEWNITSQSFGEDLYFSGSMTDFFNSGFKTAYTCIHDYFDSTKENNQGIGFIEEITDDENKTVNMGQLEALRNDVAGWLATNHYTSVSDVVNDTERECNLSDLIAIYTSKQPYVG